jgi:acyl-CoA reductase-like NAD-dependent aldehyde dehydrogenase
MPSAAAPAEGSPVPFFINGKEVHPERKFSVVSPSSGKVVHEAASATEPDVRAAVDTAAVAFKAWRKSLPKTRRDIFLKAAEIMERRKEELAGYMMAETGCPRQWGDFNVTTAREMILDVAGRLTGLEGTIPTVADPNSGAMILREPFGVVLAIAPWYAAQLLPKRVTTNTI